MDVLSTSQSGKIAEYYLASAIMSGTAGRLSPFLPASDDHGIDLVAMDKLSAACLGIQVKSWRASRGQNRNTVQFDVRKATFLATSRLVLVAMIIEPSEMSFELGWLIPMDRVPAIATEQPSKYALSPSRSHDSKDRYANYRHTDVKSLVLALESSLPH